MFILKQCLIIQMLIFVGSFKECQAKDTCWPCKCHPDHKFHGILASCSGMEMTAVPKYLPQSTTTLLLRNNKIKHVPNASFRKLPNLVFLDLSNNAKLAFEDGSFVGLSKLRLLMLYYDYAGRTNDSATTHGGYPDKSLSTLTSLEELHINGLQSDFGRGFKQLKHLKNLSLSSGYCNIGQLRNTTFQNVPFVEYLNISNCFITNAESLTFSALVNVHTIDISLNRALGFRKLSKAIYGLRYTPIKVLKLNYIYPEYGSCSKILRSDFFYLMNSSLTHLHMDGNGITGAESDVVSNFPRKLEFISARDNRFAFGFYMLEFLSVSALKYIDFSLMNAWHTFPFHTNSEEEIFSKQFPIQFPPNLETIVAQKCYIKGVFSRSEFQTNNLRKIIANYNLLYGIEGPVIGIEKIEYWDLSHNQLQTIDGDFFAVNNSVAYFNVAHNFLGKQLENDINGKFFSRLHHAKLVDISHNLIDSLPVEIFQGLQEVETMKITGNFLEHFESRVNHLSQLKLIDLSNNKIQRLSQKTIQEFGNLTRTNINLRGNPLLCNCQEMYFINWMNKNRKRFLHLSQITCELPNGTVTHMNKLHEIMDNLLSHCQTTNSISHAVIAASACVFIMCIICMSLAYRHRWKIRYFYHIAKRRYWRANPVRNVQEQYEYDVFVSYADIDRAIVIQEMISELEDKAGLKLCIHHRDFLVGEAINTNIVNAIDSSKKTLIILSPDFLQSDWCIYEYQIALQARVTRRQNSLLILLYKHVPVQDLPKDMAALLSTNCYLAYNPDVYGREAFWQNLVEAIRISQPLE